jgi:hypothetical protein
MIAIEDLISVNQSVFLSSGPDGTPWLIGGASFSMIC